MACKHSGLAVGTMLAVGLSIAALATQTATSQAGDMSSKDEIMAAVSDKTYQGSMLKDAFVEYYDPDGTIRGEGYSGKWRVEEGTMCFQYGDGAERCFAVEVNGPAMTMYKDGKVDGNGILIEGNPNKF